MGTYTYFFPNDQYPEDYLQGFEGIDYNPNIGDLLAHGNYTLSTSSEAVYQMTNGIDFQIFGTGLTYDSDGTIDGGMISSVKLVEPDHTTVMQQITGLSVNGSDFKTAVNSGDSYQTTDLLLHGDDTIVGTSGSDDFYGGPGKNKITGGNGDDSLINGIGADTFDGGAGSNGIGFQHAYYYPAGTSGVYVDATRGRDIDPWGNHESFKNVDRFRGTQYDDIFKGSAANETFQGLGGHDVIDGGGGEDTVRYNGREVEFGGTAGVTVDLSRGTAIDGFGDRDTLRNIEDVQGTYTRDRLIGSSGSNLIQGDGGSDVMTGGSGTDTFLYNAVSDSTGSVADRITDFSADDKISVTNFDTDTKLSFSEATAGTYGFLALKDGADSMRIRLDGNFSQSNFAMTADPSGAGVFVTYGNAMV